jgi:hypothetical protein
MWRAGFGRGFGPVVRQTAKWMNIKHPLTVALPVFTITGHVSIYCVSSHNKEEMRKILNSFDRIRPFSLIVHQRTLSLMANTDCHRFWHDCCPVIRWGPVYPVRPVFCCPVMRWGPVYPVRPMSCCPVVRWGSVYPLRPVSCCPVVRWSPVTITVKLTAKLGERIHDPEFDSQQDQETFLFIRTSRPSVGPTQPSVQWAPGSCFSESWQLSLTGS